MADKRWATRMRVPKLVQSMGAIVIARLISMMIGVVANILVTRIIVNDAGVGGFSTVATVSTISLLVPFADLGVGAGLVNETVDYRRTGNLQRFLKVLKAALTVAGLSSLVLFTFGAAISLSVGWSGILGAGAQGMLRPDLTMAVLALIIAVGVPLGLGARVLQGTGQIISVMVAQAVIPPLTWLWMVVASAMSAPLDVYCLGAPAAVTVSGLLIGWRASQSVRVSLIQVLRCNSERALYRAILVGGLSFTAITVSLAVAFQTDRIVLSHLSTASQLAIYALIGPVYAAAMS